MKVIICILQLYIFLGGKKKKTQEKSQSVQLCSCYSNWVPYFTVFNKSLLYNKEWEQKD